MTTELLDRAPPHNEHEETALLNAMIVDVTNIDRVASISTADDFYDVDKGRLYGALITLHEAGKPVGDVTVLCSELRRMNLGETWNQATLVGIAGAGSASSLCCCSFCKVQNSLP